MGFGGWPNAAEISTITITYLKNKLRARKFGEIKPEKFYEFSTLRPFGSIRRGTIRKIELPSNSFFFVRNEDAESDVIFFLGVEPHLNWTEYLDCLMEVVQRFNVRRIITVGGTYDRIPHTHEPIVSALVNFPALWNELRKYRIVPSEYEGPISIHTMLLDRGRREGVEAISLWGHAPHYIQMQNPKVAFHVMRRLVKILKLDVDFSDLEEAGRQFDLELERMLAQKPEIRDYVRRLEEEYREPAPMQLPETEEIIQEVEEFLKGKEEKEDE